MANVHTGQQSWNILYKLQIPELWAFWCWKHFISISGLYSVVLRVALSDSRRKILLTFSTKRCSCLMTWPPAVWSTCYRHGRLLAFKNKARNLRACCQINGACPDVKASPLKLSCPWWCCAVLTRFVQKYFIWNSHSCTAEKKYSCIIHVFFTPVW